MKHLWAQACALAALLLPPGFASAQIVGLHLMSSHNPSHMQSGQAFNNVNPGLYMRLDNGLTAGAYRNSDYKDTVYAGWTTPEWNRLSLTVGAATGYEPPLIVMGVLTARVLSLGDYSARIAYIPQVEVKGAQVLHLMVEKQFR